MNSKKKAFLEKFCVKESINLIVLETFAVTGISLWVGWGGTALSVHTSQPIRAPSTSHQIFTSSPTKSLLPHIVI